MMTNHECPISPCAKICLDDSRAEEFAIWTPGSMPDHAKGFSFADDALSTAAGTACDEGEGSVRVREKLVEVIARQDTMIANLIQRCSRLEGATLPGFECTSPLGSSISASPATACNLADSPSPSDSASQVETKKLQAKLEALRTQVGDRSEGAEVARLGASLESELRALVALRQGEQQRSLEASDMYMKLKADFDSLKEVVETASLHKRTAVPKRAVAGASLASSRTSLQPRFPAGGAPLPPKSGSSRSLNAGDLSMPKTQRSTLGAPKSQRSTLGAPKSERMSPGSRNHTSNGNKSAASARSASSSPRAQTRTLSPSGRVPSTDSHRGAAGQMRLGASSPGAPPPHTLSPKLHGRSLLSPTPLAGTRIKSPTQSQRSGGRHLPANANSTRMPPDRASSGSCSHPAIRPVGADSGGLGFSGGDSGELSLSSAEATTIRQMPRQPLTNPGTISLSSVAARASQVLNSSDALWEGSQCLSPRLVIAGRIGPPPAIPEKPGVFTGHLGEWNGTTLPQPVVHARPAELRIMSGRTQSRVL